MDVREGALLLDLGDLLEQIFVEPELFFRHLFAAVRSVDFHSLQLGDSLLRFEHDTHSVLAPRQIFLSLLSHLLLVFSNLEIDLLLVELSLLLTLQFCVA